LWFSSFIHTLQVHRVWIFCFFDEFCLEIDKRVLLNRLISAFAWELDNSLTSRLILHLWVEIILILVNTICIKVHSIIWSRLISDIILRTRLIWSSNTVVAFRYQNWIWIRKLKEIESVIKYILIEISIMKLAKCISDNINRWTTRI
jgi:hypothetical protein